MEKRVVISGLGAITPIGVGAQTFWERLIKGACGSGDIKGFDTSAYKVHKGAEVKDFDAKRFIKDEALISNIGMASQYAISACRMAIEDSKLDLAKLDLARFGSSIGTTMGEIKIFENESSKLALDGYLGLNKTQLNAYPPHSIPCNVNSFFRLGGPIMMIPNACAAGNYAIGFAYDMIRKGKADFMFAGGVDAMSVIAFTGFARLLSLAPEKCQPFDKNRKGLMVGEGCGMLLLETLECARARGANIYAQLLGWGASCDANHVTMPHPEGKYVAQAMEKALKNSGINKNEVKYISAHGTGTLANDKAETLAIKKVFGDSTKIPVSSIKSMMGHTMGAASAIEAVACCLSIKEGIIPPTINYETPDPECDLDYVPNKARRGEFDVILSNSSAFGGNNAVIVLKKV